MRVAPGPPALDPGTRTHAPECVASLGLNEELWENRSFDDNRTGGCLRWPEHLWLVSTHGELVPGRCRSTNQCEYCAKLAAIENAEMLTLDACEGDAPELWAVLGTSEVTVDMALFYAARKEVFRRLRDQFGRVEYASLLEYTTGYGPRSGGERRPHWNILLKGIPTDARRRARKIMVDAWCGPGGAPGALPAAQFIAVVKDLGGLMGYVALHFQKESQAPPAGFRGQRFNCSRGYFTGHTRAGMRELARDAIAERRLLNKARKASGLDGDALEEYVDQLYAEQGLPAWGIYSELHEPMPTPDTEIAHVPLPALEAAFEFAEWGDDHLWRRKTELERKAAAREYRAAAWDDYMDGSGQPSDLSASITRAGLM